MTRPCLQRAVGHASAPSTQPRNVARPVALLQQLHPPQLELELELGLGQLQAVRRHHHAVSVVDWGVSVTREGKAGGCVTPSCLSCFSGGLQIDLGELPAGIPPPTGISAQQAVANLHNVRAHNRHRHRGPPLSTTAHLTRAARRVLDVTQAQQKLSRSVAAGRDPLEDALAAPLRVAQAEDTESDNEVSGCEACSSQPVRGNKLTNHAARRALCHAEGIWTSIKPQASSVRCCAVLSLLCMSLTLAQMCLLMSE